MKDFYLQQRECKLWYCYFNLRTLIHLPAFVLRGISVPVHILSVLVRIK